MDLDWVPLVATQRALYDMPRGGARFKEYLRVLRDRTGDLELPLAEMNPMGHDHIPALLDQLTAIAAEDVGEAAMRDAAGATTDVAGRFRMGIVIADDLRGLWTDRVATEFGVRFESRPYDRRGWLVTQLWSSEAVSAELVREQTLVSVHRAAHILRHGYAGTLGDMLNQEGQAMAAAGCREPSLEPDDLDYTRRVVGPLRDARDRQTVIGCLFGDGAARRLGYRPHGLSARAGLALALADARDRIAS